MRKAAWRRDIAALLAVVLCFYSVLALVAPVRALANPEICTAPPADGSTAPAGTEHGATCLLCLPGCSTLPFGAPQPFAAPSLVGTEHFGATPLQTRDAVRPDFLHRPRGPPAAA